MPRQLVKPCDDCRPLDKCFPETFFQVPCDMAARAVRLKFSGADWAVWAYLQMLDPYGDKLIPIPKPREIGASIGYSYKQVMRSIEKLRSLGFYEFEIDACRGRSIAGFNARQICKKRKNPVETKLSICGQLCPQMDKVVHEKDKVVHASIYIKDSLDSLQTLTEASEGEKEGTEPEKEEPAQEVRAEVSTPNESEKFNPCENRDSHEGKNFAAGRDVLSQAFDTRALHLLKEPIFLHWWANRVEKTKFGNQELEMPPLAYVKARIRKNPEQALDMWECFQDEMGHRVDNFQLRVENGCVISEEEKEAIANIAPYTPSIALSGAVEVPKLPSAPSGENAGAYGVYKPESVDVAPPPVSLGDELAKIMAKMSMSKSKQQDTTSRLERLRQDLQDPILRPEIVRIIQNSDEFNLVFDENGNPIDVLEEAW